ncbi:DUF3440 domain-containing protein, partial [Salmonella enterica subsp. enterica serovar Anatum]|nr:DUF3440 domain-containing protein [Salmonella enterica subsp. enterica serovar Anatum]
GMHTIPQTQHGDIGSRDIPSWRRICKVLLNNDYWCRALSFSPCTSRCHHALPIPYLSLFRSVLFLPSDCIFL